RRPSRFGLGAPTPIRPATTMRAAQRNISGIRGLPAAAVAVRRFALCTLLNGNLPSQLQANAEPPVEGSRPIANFCCADFLLRFGVDFQTAAGRDDPCPAGILQSQCFSRALPALR